MELYTQTSFELSKHLTERYSTSFSSSSTLFSASIRPAIYAIYGLVRVADEIVDTYRGHDMDYHLTALEKEVLALITASNPFSANPIIHAFVVTSRQYSIGAELIQPFFASMRADISAKNFSQVEYNTYIYGSAEVIGLMCLKVFTKGDTAAYETLEPGAKSLGAAYQKINFLRDCQDDFKERGRLYFPDITSLEDLDDHARQLIVADIYADIKRADPYIDQLPKEAKRAVRLSYLYYKALLSKLSKLPIEHIIESRVSVPRHIKIKLFLQARYS